MRYRILMVVGPKRAKIIREAIVRAGAEKFLLVLEGDAPNEYELRKKMNKQYDMSTFWHELHKIQEGEIL